MSTFSTTLSLQNELLNNHERFYYFGLYWLKIVFLNLRVGHTKGENFSRWDSLFKEQEYQKQTHDFNFSSDRRQYTRILVFVVRNSEISYLKCVKKNCN